MTLIWWGKRNTFLANNINKQRFIILMNEKLEFASIKTFHAKCVADILIVHANTRYKVCNQQNNNYSRRWYGSCGWVCVGMILPPIHCLNQTKSKSLCGISIKPGIVNTQYMYSRSVCNTWFRYNALYEIFWIDKGTALHYNNYA